MIGYTKLFSEIVTSTIWQEPNDCRVLWITMLALKDRDHLCRATVPALAKLAAISLEDCEAYLDKFQQPDKYSRSQEFDGRRIERKDEGWLILNGEKYRHKMSADDRREKVRVNVAVHRAKKRANGSGVKPEHVDAPKVTWDAENGFRNITAEMREEWARGYPACNVEIQLAQMNIWLKANPAKARKSNWAAFVTNWFKRSQDRGGDAQSAPRLSGREAEHARAAAIHTKPSKFKDAHGTPL